MYGIFASLADSKNLNVHRAAVVDHNIFLFMFTSLTGFVVCCLSGEAFVQSALTIVTTIILFLSADQVDR